MTTQPAPRAAHPYHMYDAILEQPRAIARVLREEAGAVKNLAQAAARAARLHVVGIGTSWHASLVGEWLLRTVAGRGDALAWNSFEFCAYPPRLNGGDLVIVMSHRGTKRYSLYALEAASKPGATAALVTGVGSRARTDLAAHVVRTVHEEKSAAFTVSHTCAMTVLALLVAEVGSIQGTAEARTLLSDLARLPSLVQSALAKEEDVRQWAERSADVHRFYFTGWGPNAATAYEVALKVKEAAYLVTEGFQLEQYLHGPYVATDPGDMVTFVAPPGPGRERAKDIMRAARTVGARTAALIEEGEEEVASLVDTAIELPQMPEALTPIAYLVPLQLFAYWLAVGHGRNPDAFRLDNPAHKAARENYQL